MKAIGSVGRRALVQLLFDAVHNGLAEGVRLLPVAEPLLLLRQAQHPVDALRQSHVAEHSHHVVPVLFDQAFPI